MIGTRDKTNTPSGPRGPGIPGKPRPKMGPKGGKRPTKGT